MPNFDGTQIVTWTSHDKSSAGEVVGQLLRNNFTSGTFVVRSPCDNLAADKHGLIFEKSYLLRPCLYTLKFAA